MERSRSDKNRLHRHRSADRPLSPTGNQGFTLTELLVTLGLMATVAVMAVPAFQFISASANVQGAVQTLCQDLQLAKMRAISQGTSTKVLFLNSTSYKFQYFDNKNTFTWQDLNGEPIRDFNNASSPYFYQNVALTPPNGNEFVFQQYGSCNAGSLSVKNSKKMGTISLTTTGKISSQVTNL